MKRLIILSGIVLVGLIAENSLQAADRYQVTLPPYPQQNIPSQQITPPDPAEEEAENNDSIQSETPLESFFNGVLEWLYEPEPEAKQQTERRTQKRSSEQGQTTQKQKVSIWQ